MPKKAFFLLIFITGNIISFAQLGGLYTYDFLEIPLSARAAALGGNQVPIYDKDVTLALYNPSLLNPSMGNYINLCYTDYPSDIQFGNVAYCKSFNNGFMGLANIQYLNYGKFEKADEYGNIIGSFSGGDYAFNFSASREVYKRLIVGATFKLIYSSLESYNSYGFATDYAVSYHDSAGLFTASFVINNLGPQIKTYSGTRENLPLNVQIGASKKFKHMPLRIIVVAHHLNVPDFTYYDPSKNNQNIFDTSQGKNNQRPLSEKIFRHIIVGGELMFSKNFFFDFGYNHQRRKEMEFEGRPGFTGFSWGFGMRISKFHITYGNARYDLGGASNYFSISANLSDFYKNGRK